MSPFNAAEEEAQADRLAVHIAYDAGYNPLGLSEMFRMFESMSPSSRKRWDLILQNTSQGEETTSRHVGLVIEYPEHFVIMSFYLPAELFEKYVLVFQTMVSKFHIRTS